MNAVTIDRNAWYDTLALRRMLNVSTRQITIYQKRGLRLTPLGDGRKVCKGEWLEDFLEGKYQEASA